MCIQRVGIVSSDASRHQIPPRLTNKQVHWMPLSEVGDARELLALRAQFGTAIISSRTIWVLQHA